VRGFAARPPPAGGLGALEGVAFGAYFSLLRRTCGAVPAGPYAMSVAWRWWYVGFGFAAWVRYEVATVHGCVLLSWSCCGRRSRPNQ